MLFLYNFFDSSPNLTRIVPLEPPLASCYSRAQQQDQHDASAKLGLGFAVGKLISAEHDFFLILQNLFTPSIH
jgi:hypothetical protein